MDAITLNTNWIEGRKRNFTQQRTATSEMELELTDDSAPTVQLTQRHQYQNLSRPNSLLGPEKEPIKFPINLVGAPPEVEQLIEHIKDVASQFLYHWKTFPISEFNAVRCALVGT